jgi:hypothetical protein
LNQMNDNIEGSSGKYALLLQSEFDTQQEMGMKAFLSDWREAWNRRKDLHQSNSLKGSLFILPHTRTLFSDDPHRKTYPEKPQTY